MSHFPPCSFSRFLQVTTFISFYVSLCKYKKILSSLCVFPLSYSKGRSIHYTVLHSVHLTSVSFHINTDRGSLLFKKEWLLHVPSHNRATPDLIPLVSIQGVAIKSNATEDKPVQHVT